MKPTIAKVVNPLGTVVNVHSDEDIEQDPVEEDVIHENCDEALFRPFVASKTVAYQNKVKRYGDNIITKSLEGTTEVAVKVLKKGENKHYNSLPTSPAKPEKEEVYTDMPKSLKHGIEVCMDNKSKQICDPNTNVITNNVVNVNPNHDIMTSLRESEGIIFDVPPPLENEDFFSLEHISKVDTFEDAVDCEDNCKAMSKRDKKDSAKKSNTHDEDIVIEEKFVSKKSRKPKSKLGVKIVTVNTDYSKLEKTNVDYSAEITLPTPLKRSWNTVAASKPNDKTVLLKEEKKNTEELPPIDIIEEFTVTLPRKTCITTSDLIDIETPIQEKSLSDQLTKDLLDVSGDSNLLKIEKSSDDEKGESSSSQAEVTESDDSGRVPDISVFENLTESKTVIQTKSSKRKKKKK